MLKSKRNRELREMAKTFQLQLKQPPSPGLTAVGAEDATGRSVVQQERAEDGQNRPPRNGYPAAARPAPKLKASCYFGPIVCQNAPALLRE